MSDVIVNVDEFDVNIVDDVVAVGVETIESRVEVNSGVFGDASYTHNQNSASSSWTVYHELGRRPVIVLVQNNEVVEGRITYPNLDSALIEFGSPQTGTAYCY